MIKNISSPNFENCAFLWSIVLLLITCLTCVLHLQMKALHMNVLHAELNQDDKAAIATIDPTKGTF